MECTIVKQGDTLRRDVSLTYKKTNNAVVDLTGCTAFSQLRTKPGEVLCCEGTCTIDTDTGIVSVVYSKDQTGELKEGDYGFDIRLELDDDRVTIYTERFTLIQPYTELGSDEEDESL